MKATIDPKIANMVSKEIAKESIVVFDEAHNIDNICIEALSVTLNRRIVQASTANIKKLETVLLSALY
jgi:DNA excision repair protein ERCC-2